MPEMETRLRSDALENRERILKVAIAELTQRPDVALSAIAKKAGVGQATFYRNFPSREALVLELYRYEMERVANLAAELLRTLPPEQALREWMDGLAQYAVTKAGLPDAIRQAASDRACPGTSSGYAPVPAAAQLLLDANHQAGTIRPGVTVDDFFLATAGIWQIDSRGDWHSRLSRLMDLVMDGLRVGAPRPEDRSLLIVHVDQTQGAGAASIHLLAAVFGQPGRQRDPELLERNPQPAGPAVGLALGAQSREQVAPVAGHLGQEPGLAAPAQQVPHLGDGQQLGIAAGRRPRPGRDRDRPGNHQVMDEHVDVDEQVFSLATWGTASADKGLRQSLVFRRGRLMLKPTRRDQPT